MKEHNRKLEFQQTIDIYHNQFQNWSNIDPDEKTKILKEFELASNFAKLNNSEKKVPNPVFLAPKENN